MSYAILLAFAAFYVGPILMLVSTSLKTLPEFFKDPTGRPPNPSLDNFTNAWDLANFPGYAVNSVIYTIVATALFVVTSVMVAFPIARGYVRGSRRAARAVRRRPVPPACAHPAVPADPVARAVQLPAGVHPAVPRQPDRADHSRQLHQVGPVELDHAAAVDGCGYVRFVWSVLIPLIRPAVATVTVLHAIGIWNELILATIYLTNDDLYPITRGLIVFEGVYGSDWPALAAAVLMLMIPMLVLFVFLQRYIVSGLTAGAVKG